MYRYLFLIMIKLPITDYAWNCRTEYTDRFAVVGKMSQKLWTKSYRKILTHNKLIVTPFRTAVLQSHNIPRFFALLQ